ncbi:MULTISPECIES: hypothetical protein [Streptomyces]|uniref:Secreted protein n=1 Tax=Streptomyces fuscus TaxID=3048495 RepID=A0ABT7J1Z2_9ACTN|nr:MULTISPECIES: hypothetical protein [Streptomyces]MCM1968779.1 hypothetical protein [Streptomyces sp. G1]MDL2078876.1 hypothetical protein [Streptomyces fuscus]SBT93516.1 hypothetical protein GA0115233_106531 [Streptomyces sp. DI166]
MSEVKKRFGVRRVLAVSGAVLLAGALVAGVGHTVLTVRDADRDAGAPRWEFPPERSSDETGTPSPSGLAGRLVPYGTYGWTTGPDLDEFGSDVSLSGAQAAALRKESLRDLPRTQRRALEKQIDRSEITAMAMRSYVLAEGEDSAAVSIVLAEMENRTTVRETSTFQSELLGSLDFFRAGPKIEGYKNARCYLSPKEADENLDYLFCTAHQGNVLITATASAIRPLDTEELATLFRVQLDRIADPGERV